MAAIVHITEYQTITKNNAVEWAMSTSEWTIANKRENGLCGTVGLVHCKSKFSQWPCPCPCKPTHAPSLPPLDGHFLQWPCPGCPCEPACTPSLLPSDSQFSQWSCPCPCKPTCAPSLPPLDGPCTAVCFFKWPCMPPSDAKYVLGACWTLNHLLLIYSIINCAVAHLLTFFKEIFHDNIETPSGHGTCWCLCHVVNLGNKIFKNLQVDQT